VTARARLRGDDLIAERELSAAIERVWTAFTSPAGIAAFWGGSHAVVPADSVAVDLRVGGEFVLDTRAGAGPVHRLRFVYVSVEPPSRLVFDEPLTGIRTTVSMRPAGGGTHLSVHQRRLPPELRTAQATDGLAAILDALAGHLEHVDRT
jgi:uncharacterized protein YndB with AHSA1/START domain